MLINALHQTFLV